MSAAAPPRDQLDLEITTLMAKRRALYGIQPGERICIFEMKVGDVIIVATNTECTRKEVRGVEAQGNWVIFSDGTVLGNASFCVLSQRGGGEKKA